MNEITEGLVKTGIFKNFAEKYKIKEISRFQNKLLFDPISEVASQLKTWKKIELYYHCDLLKEINTLPKMLLLKLKLH